MCDEHCIEFATGVLTDVHGRDILEVGAYDVNGSVRPYVIPQCPSLYFGVDLREGPNVDEVCDVVDLVSRFGNESFDVVVSTEMLEHVRDWRRAIQNLKGVLRPLGRILLTTRRIGFPYHEHPGDYWRYEPEDMAAIFRDFERIRISTLPNCGIGLVATKPDAGWQPISLDQIELFRVVPD